MSGLPANPQSNLQEIQLGELALQHHLVTTGKLQPEGDLGPKRSARTMTLGFSCFISNTLQAQWPCKVQQKRGTRG